MKSSQFPISRRTMLRGLGGTLALPWLEAMLPRRALAAAAAAKPPVRMAVLYMPNGVNPHQWTPEGEGRDFKFSPTLEPLAELKNDVLVATNLWNRGSEASEGHYVKTSGFLTCTTITKTYGVDLSCNGTSMDQLAAQRRGQETPLASLELAMDSVSTGVDNNVGYTRVYGAHISWAGPARPLPREINPRTVYQRLFRASQPRSDSDGQDKLLLDRVLEDSRRLRDRLGNTDRQRLDEYLEGIRSLEQRLDKPAGGATSWQPRAAVENGRLPEEDPASHTDNVRWMMDLLALAFQSDTTRIGTFMFGNAVSGRNFSFLDGVKGGHHNISHHQKDPDKLRMYQLINRWHIEQYAYLLRKLRSMPEGEGTVLDNSLILFGAGLRDGDAHSPHNLPIVLGGRGGGRIATGQHLVYDRDTALSNLYVSMLDAFGAPVDRFADSTGPLPGVLV
ncbi:MAG: DUF1552 domain-containing protein [Pirellulales bacterium]